MVRLYEINLKLKDTWNQAPSEITFSMWQKLCLEGTESGCVNLNVWIIEDVAKPDTKTTTQTRLSVEILYG